MQNNFTRTYSKTFWDCVCRWWRWVVLLFTVQLSPSIIRT